MHATDIIAKKRDGGELTREELEFFITGYVGEDIPDYQAAAWLMAVYLRGMTVRETTDLTLLMADSGKRLDLSAIPRFKVDKHSTGGVGDKTTFVALPAACACGACSAKLSGRGLGHTGGTIDKLESIPGFVTALDFERFREVVGRAGMCVAAATVSLAPADKLLYALRDVTATVGCLPLIASSIMSKKLAGGSDAIVLDVKTGSGALMKKRVDALALAELMTRIGNGAGRPTTALVTDMDAPLGRAAGNAPEVAEALALLRGETCEADTGDLAEVSLALAAEMLGVSGLGEGGELENKVKNALSSGAAYEAFERMVSLQGGSLAEFDRLVGGSAVRELKYLGESGFVTALDTELAGRACVNLGAGRETKNDKIDPLAGIRFVVKPGEKLSRGDTLALLYKSPDAPNADVRFDAAAELLRSAYAVGETAPATRRMIHGRVGTDGKFDRAASEAGCAAGTK